MIRWIHTRIITLPIAAGCLLAACAARAEETNEYCPVVPTEAASDDVCGGRRARAAAPRGLVAEAEAGPRLFDARLAVPLNR